MKVFVTGGAGFIGSHFIHLLLSIGAYEVVNYDKLTYAGNLENLKDIVSDKYTFVKGDICDHGDVMRAMEGCDVVVNFAAESHVDRSINVPHEFLRTNITGTHHLLEAARKLGIQKFVQISTDEVYGDLPALVLANENFPLYPSSPYSASKAASDCLAFSYFRTYGLPVVITRSANNYGPCQYPEKFIPLAITNALADRKIPVYGNGQHVRNWIDVRDNCRAILAVLEKGRSGEIYNIGATGAYRTNLDIAKFILRTLGKPESLIEFVADRPGHDKRYALDLFKIQKELNWEASADFDLRLRNTIEWYKNNQ